MPEEPHTQGGGGGPVGKVCEKEKASCFGRMVKHEIVPRCVCVCKLAEGSQRGYWWEKGNLWRVGEGWGGAKEEGREREREGAGTE